jgi:hypothetical protein
MNHIHGLTTERDEALGKIREARQALTDLQRYLSSAKFHEDNTVQIRTDIGPKILDICFGLID